MPFLIFKTKNLQLLWTSLNVLLIQIQIVILFNNKTNAKFAILVIILMLIFFVNKFKFKLVMTKPLQIFITQIFKNSQIYYILSILKEVAVFLVIKISQQFFSLMISLFVLIVIIYRVIFI